MLTKNYHYLERFGFVPSMIVPKKQRKLEKLGAIDGAKRCSSKTLFMAFEALESGILKFKDFQGSM